MHCFTSVVPYKYQRLTEPVDPEALRQAVAAVRSGTTKTDAAATFNVSRRTLSRHLHDEVIPERLTQGVHPTFSEEQERQLEEHLIELSNR